MSAVMGSAPPPAPVNSAATEDADTRVAEVSQKPKRRCGFASMSAEQRARIASLGGKAAHAQGTAHQFSKDEARDAGRKGGIAAQEARRAAEKESKP